MTLLVGRQEGHTACKNLLKRWGTGMVICLERHADLHMAQLTPLPLTVSCFSRIQIGFTFLVPAHPGSLGIRAVKRVFVRSFSVPCGADCASCSSRSRPPPPPPAPEWLSCCGSDGAGQARWLQVRRGSGLRWSSHDWDERWSTSRHLIWRCCRPVSHEREHCADTTADPVVITSHHITSHHIGPGYYLDG